MALHETSRPESAGGARRSAAPSSTRPTVTACCPAHTTIRTRCSGRIRSRAGSRCGRCVRSRER